MMNCQRFPFRYVFRRLRFLGNKTASHILTLVFLSLWHGFYVGYLILFGLEFCMLVGERQVNNINSFFLFDANCFLEIERCLFKLKIFKKLFYYRTNHNLLFNIASVRVTMLTGCVEDICNKLAGYLISNSFVLKFV